MSVFKENVLKIVKMIPEGKVVSYGQIALMAGIPRAARQVGGILQTSAEGIPWWRVINNAGRISIKNPEVGPVEQKQLLESDGIKVNENYELDIERYRWQPSEEVLRQLSLPDEYVFGLLEKFGI